MLPFNDPFAPNSPGSTANITNVNNTPRTNSTMSHEAPPSQHSLSSQSTTSGDAFSNRGAASEDMYIRQKEMDMMSKIKKARSSEVEAKQADAAAKNGEGDMK